MQDFKIYETGSGGDINILADDIERTGMIINQVYIALFGGNVEQSTTDDIPEGNENQDWWGNQLMSPENQFNSTFERTLNEITMTSSGIIKAENAAIKDLEYLSEYADIEVSASMMSEKWLHFLIQLQEPNNLSTKLKFIWDVSKDEFVSQSSEGTTLKGIGVMIIESTFIIT